MKKSKKFIAVIGLLSALLLLSSCQGASSVTKAPSSPPETQSGSGKEPVLHFDTVDAGYFYDVCNCAPDSNANGSLDPSGYFKTEEQGRRYLLENTHFSTNLYQDRYYGAQISRLAQVTRLSFLQKEYAVTFYGYEGAIDLGDYSAPVYAYGLDDYLYEQTSDHALFVSYTANDGQLHSVTLPAEEFDEKLPATAELTAEQGKAYAVQILSAMGDSVKGYEVSVFDDGKTGDRTLLRVTFTGERFGNNFVGYTVTFESRSGLPFSETVTVKRYQPYIAGAPGVAELVAQPDYEQKATEDAIAILKQDLSDESYLDRLECDGVFVRPRSDGNVGLLVCFKDKMDVDGFDLTVMLIVKP